MLFIVLPSAGVFFSSLLGFQLELENQRRLVWFSFVCITAWFVMDFFAPVLPLSKKYLAIHHSVSCISLLGFLNFEFYELFAAGIVLQEAYMIVFRKIIYSPDLELIADIFRFVSFGLLYHRYAADQPLFSTLMLCFFTLHNLYFFKLNHAKAFAVDRVPSKFFADQKTDS